MKKLNNCSILFIFVFAMPFVGISQIIEKPHISDSIESDIYNNNLDGDNIKKNTVYIELLGNGVYYSIGYGRIVEEKNNKILSIALGLSYVSSRHETVWISSQIISSRGVSRHRLELGLGYTLGLQYVYTHVIEPKILKLHYIFYRIGYQYHCKSGKFIYKLAFTPLTHFSDGWFFPIFPSAGLAICYKF